MHLYLSLQDNFVQRFAQQKTFHYLVAFLPFFIYFKGPLFSKFCGVKGKKKLKIN